MKCRIRGCKCKKYDFLSSPGTQQQGCWKKQNSLANQGQQQCSRWAVGLLIQLGEGTSVIRKSGDLALVNIFKSIGPYHSQWLLINPCGMSAAIRHPKQTCSSSGAWQGEMTATTASRTMFNMAQHRAPTSTQTAKISNEAQVPHQSKCPKNAHILLKARERSVTGNAEGKQV